jgi:glycolate oxidase
MLSPAILDELVAIVGREYVLTEPEDLVCYAYDATPIVHLPDVVVMPGNTAEVAAVVKLAHRQRLPVVPRGGSTNLSGGTVPLQGGIVLAMSRFDRLLEIDAENLTATVQPGVITADFHKAVEARGLFYPPDPASMTASTLGGNVGEGAGGPRAVKYGTTKDYVLGLEVVLPTGEVIRTGNKTVKNVAGYDLTHLFVGAEGTLGVVTEITVRLLPLPQAKQTLLAIYDDLDAAAQTVSSIIAQKIVPTTLELMDKVTMARIEAYKPVGLPLDAAATLLIEVDGDAAAVPRQAQVIAEACRACGAREVKLARSSQEADQLWTGRRAALAAAARYRPTLIVEDATVPRSQLPAAVRLVQDLAAKHQIEVAILAHAGDGNLHPLIMTDARDAVEMARVDAFSDEFFLGCLAMGGTLTGEHGIGYLKAKYMAAQFGEAGLGAMRAIKQALDPNNIMNPGKIFGA